MRELKREKSSRRVEVTADPLLPRQAGFTSRSAETPSRALEMQGYHNKLGSSPHKSREKTVRTSWLYMKVIQT
jgi:hypothetical protein